MPVEYSLPPPQVAEDAWSWLPGSDELDPTRPKAKPDLSVPSLAEIQKICDPLIAQHPFPDTAAKLEAALVELRELAKIRKDPNKLESTTPGKQRLPVSIFLQVRPQPPGAAYDKQRPITERVILTGYELARWFEKDTPNLAFSHALNYLIDTGQLANPPYKSPPNQARIWSALNVAVYAALIASWHYKWREPLTRRKPRPIEIDKTLSVLYDFNDNGSPVATPQPHPGTPRHPSYPSGHSAVAGAACELLALYFPGYRKDFDYLADNSGLARMWAGIHFRADHEFGVAMGRAIGKLIYRRANP